MSDKDYFQIYNEAKKIITEYLRLNENEVEPDTHIVNDAGADSLALVELGFQLTEKFGVQISDTSDDKLIFKILVQYIFDSCNNK